MKYNTKFHLIKKFHYSTNYLKHIFINKLFQQPLLLPNILNYSPHPKTHTSHTKLKYTLIKKY